MRSMRAISFGLAIVGSAAAAFAQMSHKHHDPKVLLTWGGMYGVDGGFVGATHPIRGVVGDESPWVIARSAKGSLSSSGHLSIAVRGLVFKDDPSVPPELRGKNDEEQFRALVSCLTESGSDTPEKNVTTAGFKADANGNANINAQVTLPDPCVAPIVFVLAGSEDKWFAVTGVELGDGG